MNSIEIAIKKLKENNVVAIPTETVYGLAARISSEEAIHKIFKTKKRPFFDPLIVHVTDANQAKQYSQEWSDIHQLLTEKFWPGPLTILVPKKNISDLITSGLPTVGIRCPKHALALAVIAGLGEPVAAPSANRFGKTSPTSLSHVLSEFNGEVHVLDGGNCEIGIESTIISISEVSSKVNITLHRSGAILPSNIEAALAPLNKNINFISPEKKIVAPGQTDHHYMPDLPIVWISKNQLENRDCSLLDTLKDITKKDFKNPSVMILNQDPVIAARELYSQMRKCSTAPNDIIISIKEHFQIGELWDSIHDRIKRAASYKAID